MQKRAIELLIVAMSLALLGIIGLQTYWLHQAYETQRQQFNTQVNEAMREVTTQLEAQEIAKPMLDDIFNEHKDSLTKKSPYIKRKRENINHGTHRVIVFNDGKSKAAAVVQENLEISSSFNNTSEKKSGISKIIRIEKGKDGVTKTETTITGNVPNADEIKAFVNINDNKLELKIRQIKETSNKLVQEIIEQHLPEKKKIKITFIDSLLKKTLQNKGMEIAYVMGVLINKDSVLSLTKDTIDITSLKHSPHTILLYPNDLLNNNARLTLFFPKERKHLWAGISLMAGVSIILTLIIIACYTATVRIVFKQKKMNDIRNDFINNMTHEFKTPLATISLAADTLQNPALDSNVEQRQHFMTIIKGESKRLQSHVESLLQMALTDRKDVPLQLVPCSFHEIAQRAIQGLQLQVENRHGHIHAFFNAKNDNIVGHHAHLSNVLFNLLDNAIKYSVNPPDIIIKTENVNDKIILSITDQGIGIPKEMQYYVFDKFYRVPTGNIHNVKGFGLGLSYAKMIVERHGGNISLQSEEGKGSTFIIELPVV